jgi:hypothetical protein
MASMGEHGIFSAHGGRMEYLVRLQRNGPAGLCDFVHEMATPAQ